MTIMHEPAETPEGKAYREWLRWGIELAWRLGKMDHLSSGEMRRVIEERLNTRDDDEDIAKLARHYVALIDQGPRSTFLTGAAHSALLSRVRADRKAA